MCGFTGDPSFAGNSTLVLKEPVSLGKQVHRWGGWNSARKLGLSIFIKLDLVRAETNDRLVVCVAVSSKTGASTAALCVAHLDVLQWRQTLHL